MTTYYRVCWQDTRTNEAHGVTVSSLEQAHLTAQSLTRENHVAGIVVYMFDRKTFNESYMTYAPRKA